jgi:hypothetical protein
MANVGGIVVGCLFGIFLFITLMILMTRMGLKKGWFEGRDVSETNSMLL